MRDRVVGIVGLGLVGGSLARALVAGGVRVVGTSRDACDARLAAACGVDVVGDVTQLAHAVGAEGVVVLATPLGALGVVADAMLPALPSSAVAVHVAGLQRREALGLDADAHARVIGTHPVAGSHGSGFAVSHAGLFAGATVLAESRAAAGARPAIEWLWDRAGARAVEYRAAESHDRTMAWVSHLPQLASVAVAAALVEAGVPAGDGGPGLRDVTRLAASPLPLWRDLLAAAPPDTLEALDRVRDLLGELRAALATADSARLTHVWARAGAWRGEPVAAA